MLWKFMGFEDASAEANNKSAEDALGSESAEEALECDYERNVTPLYRRIEDREWHPILRFLETGYWPGSFFIDPISPADQAKTWVTRFDDKDCKKVRWSQLALHLAIVIGAPFQIVARLVEIYPQSVRCTDDQHMLPLHLAMRHGSSDRVVDLLIAAFPEGVNAKGKYNRTPLECAIHGHNDVRGRILSTFVEKSKAKATKSAVTAYTQKIADLKMTLEQKETELNDVTNNLKTLNTSKAAIEQELASKAIALEQAREEMKIKTEIDDSVPSDEASIRKHIKDLEDERKHLEAEQRKAREEELNLRKELEKVQLNVVQSTPHDDLVSLQGEVRQLQAYRLETSRTAMEEDLVSLRSQAKKMAGASKTSVEATTEIKKIEQSIDNMGVTQSKSFDEITALQNELKGLRKKLEEKELASKLKVEIGLLQDALESELSDPAMLTHVEVQAIRKALERSEVSKLEALSIAELGSLKITMEKVRADLVISGHQKMPLDQMSDITSITTYDTVKDARDSSQDGKDEDKQGGDVVDELRTAESDEGTEVKIKGAGMSDLKQQVESFIVGELAHMTPEELVATKKEIEMLRNERIRAGVAV